MAMPRCNWFAASLTEYQVPFGSIPPPVKVEMEGLDRLGTHRDVPFLSTLAEDFY